jgi:hypothetical protein
MDKDLADLRDFIHGLLEAANPKDIDFIMSRETSVIVSWKNKGYELVLSPKPDFDSKEA